MPTGLPRPLADPAPRRAPARRSPEGRALAAGSPTEGPATGRSLPGPPRGLLGWALLPWLGVPALAEACATCLSTPWGDRNYTWVYLGLLLMPFLVGAAIGGVLAYLRIAARRPTSGRGTTEIEETV